MSVDIRRLLAAALVVLGIYGLAGWPAAAIVAGLWLWLTPAAGRTPSLAAQNPLTGIRTWVRGRTAVASRWADAQKLSMLLLPAAIVVTSAGLALALGPGWGTAAGGAALGAVAMQLERQDGQP